MTSRGKRLPECYSLNYVDKGVLKLIALHLPVSRLLQWSTLNKLWHYEIIDVTMLERKYPEVLVKMGRTGSIDIMYRWFYSEILKEPAIALDIPLHLMYRLVIKKCKDTESIERPWKLHPASFIEYADIPYTGGRCCDTGETGPEGHAGHQCDGKDRKTRRANERKALKAHNRKHR